jgi:hypothetical protein
VELKNYWDKLEWKRSSTFRHLPLEHSGAAAFVNDCVITRAHDRSLPLRLRMFMKSNANKKSFHNSSNNSESKEPASSWDFTKASVDIISAINNYADVYACLWPLDPTPRVLLRALLEDFCDTVLRENARKAILQDLPLSYQQAKERWRDLTELRRAGHGGAAEPSRQAAQGTRTPTTGQQAAGGFTSTAGTGGARQRGFGTGAPVGRSGIVARSGVIKFQNDLVCFHYNNAGRGCSRTPKGAGCDDGRGGCYAHVCNFETSPGQYCFARHARHANH